MRSVISLTVSSIELVPFTYWQGEIEASHADVLMASVDLVIGVFCVQDN